MTATKPKYFAVLHAAVRDNTIPKGNSGHYQVVPRDDPRANEFRVEFCIEWGGKSIPVGGDREHAESVVHALNEAFNFGIKYAGKVKMYPADEILVGRMGRINRNEEEMP